MSPRLSEAALNGLAAQSQPNTTILVLGSMPGTISLAQQQYYAHPRNHFWPIMAQLLGITPTLPYVDKVQALNARGVALWDVIGSCRRAGSLDSAIRDEQVNDFGYFFAAQPQLMAIGFNGAKALQSFKRHVVPLGIVPVQLQLFSLPSTSPAHAALSFNEKLQQWRQLLPYIVSP